jgi:hypothetical protein
VNANEALETLDRLLWTWDDSPENIAATELARAVLRAAVEDLAAARPLMDAAMNYHPADGICLALNDYITIEAEELFGAALAYRAGRTK